GDQELLEKRFMLFFTGVSRNASTILQWQKQACEKGDPAILRRLERIKGLAVEIRESLERGNLDWFGHLLHLNWLEKRQLVVGVTNPFIDECYRVARENGALGGKVTGAGGGGFLLLYCPEDRQPTVELALSKLGLTRCPFVFEGRGVQVMKLFPWASQDSMQEEDLIGVHNALV
ncbi:MAG: hypothetical protein JW981_10350, partial [Anaerolineae bacterium]|nr:hypothetical protein [Anaerolineae bacterium]